jgi:autotransporter-associated beta strand protein
VTYQLQPYTANNVLLLGANATTGSLNFAAGSQTQYQSISIMHTGGSGSPGYTFALRFSTGDPTVVTGNTAPDWFNNPNAVIQLNGRLNRNTGAFDQAGTGSTNPRIYARDFTLSAADQARTLVGIDFTYTGGAGATLDIFGVSGLTQATPQNYTNAVTVSADSTVDALSVGTVTLGPLSINGSTLAVTGSSGGGVTFGATALTGNPTFNVATGVTLTLGAVSDGGTARTITKAGAGTLALGTAAGAITAGPTVNVTGGRLNLTAAGALGTQAAVTLSPGATLNTTANQTIASLAGTGGAVTLNTNTLTVGSGTTTTFGGSIAGGPLVVSGANTVLNLTGGTSNPTSVSIQSGAKLTAAGPPALGSGTVTLANNATLSVGGIGVQSSSLTGFNGGTGWNLQGAATLPTATATALTITTAENGQANTAWFGTPVPVGPFTATFRYSQSNNTNPADGITFAFQNQNGTVVGTGGGGLAYQDLTPSAAFALSVFGGAQGGRGFNVVTNGVNPSTANPAGGNGYLPVAPVDLLAAQTGSEVTVTLSYDGTTLTGQLVQGANTFNLPPIPLNLSTLFPTGTAFVGFTGATGGLNAEQVIDNFSFTTQSLTVYNTPVSVAAGASATVNVIPAALTPTITLGPLNMGAGSTLNVAAETGTPANLAYGLTFGAATLGGAATFAVANNGTGAGTLTLGATGGATGALTKTGPGTLVLTGAGTYTGATTVSAGTLLVRGQTAAESGTGTGAVNVAAGATLGGSGRIALATNASVLFADGGRLFLQSTPTESLRLVTSGTGAVILGTSTTPGGAAVVAFKLSAPGNPAAANSGGSTTGTLPNPTNHGFVTTTGQVSATLGLKFEIDGTGVAFTEGQAYSYRIAQLTGWAGGVVPLTTPASFSTIGFQATGLSAQVSATGDVFVNFTPVPEPGTALALAAAGLGFGGLVRRKLRGRPVA